MRCTKCDSEVPENSKFCINCGSPVEQDKEEKPAGPFVAESEYRPMQEPITATSGTQNSVKPKKKLSGPLIAILVICAVLFSCLIIGGIASLFGGGNKTEDSSAAATIESNDATTAATTTAKPTATPTPLPTATPTPEPTPMPTLSIEEKAASYPTGNYDEYARNPDSYMYGTVQITGNVVQVQEGDDFNVYRIATDDYYDEVWYVEYVPVQGESRILEDDTVTVYGFYYGIITYETVMGNELSIPAIVAENVIVKN